MLGTGSARAIEEALDILPLLKTVLGGCYYIYIGLLNIVSFPGLENSQVLRNWHLLDRFMLVTG